MGKLRAHHAKATATVGPTRGSQGNSTGDHTTQVAKDGVQPNRGSGGHYVTGLIGAPCSSDPWDLQAPIANPLGLLGVLGLRASPVERAPI